ncbi:polyketide synthase [uncultured Bifidobacterium sp.]|uniref:polyketide synthase n=1 Tax=uncultured Bifidobacterium sp. TaxID=165187 RepID=UPI0028DB26F2|nr:polyketide synthase [uncultured Bifidobacterium sp.]
MTTTTDTFLARLHAEPHALVFAGQGVAWAAGLARLLEDPVLGPVLRGAAADAEDLLHPVSADLMKAVGGAVDVPAVAAGADGRLRTEDVAMSVPGIALAQLASMLDLVSLGYDPSSRPLAVLGHSQGLLAEEMASSALHADPTAGVSDAAVRVLALARLIGAAASRQARIAGVAPRLGESTPMLSATGVTPAQARTLVSRLTGTRGPLEVSVVNAHDRVVLSGHPQDLEAWGRAARDEARDEKRERSRGRRGGSPFAPVLEYLDVTVPFHSPLMEGAVDAVVDWAAACGLDPDRARALARGILVEPVDWAGRVRGLLSGTDATRLWIVDMGPGTAVGRLTESLAEGTGAGVVDASSPDSRSGLSTSDRVPKRLQDWGRFLPRPVDTPSGRRLVTRFSQLTGKPPVLLAGMTPTTVDPGIVAAAANAGYWAELAGGGQVTAEVFDRHMDRLGELLDDGATVEFNAMFMDRYLWGLQFGSSRIVPRRRAAGAPIDGVVVSAGIPAQDEAVRLVRALRRDGFPYVAFKPGTVEQIRQVVAIAESVAPVPVIMQVEGGSAGGHHSWESLDDLLESTYARIREHDNLVLVVGGGIGTPERTADYLIGRWSRRRGLPVMPVDGVMIGTAAMTVREALTSPDVKRLLVATPGVAASQGASGVGGDGGPDPFAPHDAWVPSGEVRGGMTSGLSHLHADIYEVENSSSRCGRLLARLQRHPEEIPARRDEIVRALDVTAKPYFGELDSMTYERWARRFAELSFPWADGTYVDRFLHLLRRIEARVCGEDRGEVVSLFPDAEAVRDDPQTAVDRLVRRYPTARSLVVEPQDAAWFPQLVREYPKPMPFVPVIDEDLLRWWGQDQLWQSQDARYPADAVRVIPGPVSVAGITTMDEPVAHLLRRFEQAAVDGVTGMGEKPEPLASALGSSHSVEAFVRRCPTISWLGRLVANPAVAIESSRVPQDPAGPLCRVRALPVPDGEGGAEGSDGAVVAVDLDIPLDVAGDVRDGDPGHHAVRDITIPLVVDVSVPGRVPCVDAKRLPDHVRALLAATAGVGGRGAGGDAIASLPEIGGIDDAHPWGVARHPYTLSANLGADHEAATAGDMGEGLEPSRIVPDALTGPAWPAIYAALGSLSRDGVPVIEGLLDAVHLDHSIRLDVVEDELLAHVGERVTAEAWADPCSESSSGRLVAIHVLHRLADGRVLARETERFAIRGRIGSTHAPEPARPFGGTVDDGERVDVTRRLLRRARLTAPLDMTAFARTSGDFNPIHTSRRAAAVAGLGASLVHGMWLSAAVQHLIQAHGDPVADMGRGWQIAGWTYSMFGMVGLGDPVDVEIDRIGRVRHGGLLLEVTCRIRGEVVSQGTAVARSARTAYVYPGQGVQSRGMTLDDRTSSPAVREVWRRADAVTRERLGFSILAVVRDNPARIMAKGVEYRHPDGLLNLTQFTQVALATVAFAQTARLREAGVDVWPAAFAGHSLGEYTALSAFAGIIPLETTLELVFHRGSTMHHLIPRDADGRSNYRMAALRPNQFGVGDEEVTDYVEGVARECGEFLQIVNYNLEGRQYAIAGTIAGLEALRRDSEHRSREMGGRPPFMLVPGIDVPFHSRLLRGGVPEFRRRLEKLLPQDIDFGRLVGRYIPNLVARPFELTRDFASSILEVAPSQPVREALADPALWEGSTAADRRLGRLLLVELLAWQFASPVRWIETQRLLFSSRSAGGLGVEQCIEVGLAKAPTLANMAARTLSLPAFAGAGTVVWNVGRDESRVYMTDSDPLPGAVRDDSRGDVDDDGGVRVDGDHVPSAGPASFGGPASPASGSAPVVRGGAASRPRPVGSSDALSGPASPGPASSAPASEGSDSTAGTPDVPFTASDAIRALIAHEARLRPDQIGDADTTDTLTNGVSSRRNQLIMDLGVELAVPSVDGAADAPVSRLLPMVDHAAPTYRPFGPVLDDVVRSRIHAVLGSAGLGRQQVEERVRSVWGLGEGWVGHVLLALALGTRDGESVRGGDLATLPASPAVDVPSAKALIDAAVNLVASVHGVAVSLPRSSQGVGSGAVVDSAALDAFADRIAGREGVLASAARLVLDRLGVSAPLPTGDPDADARALTDTVTAELGPDWPRQVQPRFEARRAILLDDRWALAREDVARIFHEHDERAMRRHMVGAGRAVHDEARWFATRAREHGDADAAEVLERLAREALEEPSSGESGSAGSTSAGTTAGGAAQAAPSFRGDVAVVTGVAPRSIAGAVVTGLLDGGATVVAVCHTLDAPMRLWARDAYRDHGTQGSALWLVPANLASYRDVDALTSWIVDEQTESSGASRTVVKPALEPDLLLPFAAPRMQGTLEDAGPLFESQARLMLWGVERLVAGLARAGEGTDVDHRLHVVLPGSPNRGVFGGDGAYGEIKGAFDALVARSRSETGWSRRVTFAHPLIGWVRGTGLMGGNDPLVKAAEEAGIRTFSTDEVARGLLGLASPEARGRAWEAPLEKNLTGGLGSGPVDIRALRRRAQEMAAGEAPDAAAVDRATSSDSAPIGSDEHGPSRAGMLRALPTPRIPRVTVVDPEEWGPVEEPPEKQIVIVSVGELGPWGSGRTRFEAEMGIDPSGDVDLSASAVLELAWGMGLVSWQTGPVPGWYDEDGNAVPEEDIALRFHDEVLARCGIRPFEDGMGGDYRQGTGEKEAEVFLDHDVRFTVADETRAREYAELDPDHTDVRRDPSSGEWTVTRRRGAMVRVPRRAAMRRTAGGQIPTGFDPRRWGIPASMVDEVDPIALWNLVTAVDAYLSAGITPAEILRSVHPSRVADTQGTGFGGMRSMRRLYLDRFLGHDVPLDILQEALPNVVAAHVMQSYVGGYGCMVQPVSACATAAVSLEEACDKIALGKADVVVAGAIDDIGVESVEGFGGMNATADTAAMTGRGIDVRFLSRANDRRRGGFVESQGGGTILVTRGDVALRLGLPVSAVVGYVHSFADGIHTSIPAPGLGALAAGLGGADSDLARRLGRLGVSADDIAVVSKHDTSTKANDPNESELHDALATAIGRHDGNPLFVVSQKTLTGHAKGGACVFQINGLTQLFATGTIPGNAALDCVDPAMRGDSHMVWLRSPLHLGLVRAALATSLGFGHVSGVVALVHPGAFESAVASFRGRETLEEWRRRADERLRSGRRRILAGMMGGAPLYEPVDGRRLPDDASGDAHAAEKSMLLDSDARLGSDGTYRS